MKYLFLKKKTIIYSIIKYELVRLKYKYLFYNTKLPFFIRQKAFFFLNALPRNSSIMKLRGRCLISNRSYSVQKFFNLTRFSIKLQIYKNRLSGVKNIRW